MSVIVLALGSPDARRKPENTAMPKIDIAAAPQRQGSNYPAPFDQPCAGRRRWALGDAAGLDQFGVNLLRLPPGQWSSQRHWHSAEDEFVWVVEGEVVLVEDSLSEGGGETILRAPMAGTRQSIRFPSAHV